MLGSCVFFIEAMATTHMQKRSTVKTVVWAVAVLVLCLLGFAVLFPVFAQADRYSGPGRIREALLIGLDGKLVKRRQVTLAVRGGRQTQIVETDDLGEIHLPTHSRYDAIVGFERRGMTQPGPDGMLHPIFWEIDPTARAVEIYEDPGKPGELLTANWPTPQQPALKLSAAPWPPRDRRKTKS